MTRIAIDRAVLFVVAYNLENKCNKAISMVFEYCMSIDVTISTTKPFMLILL